MAETGFPVFEVPDLEEAGTEYDTTYKRSMKWSVEEGDFVRDGAGRIAGCDGKEAYMIWCFKTVQTECGACPAYPAEIGVEMETAMGGSSRKAAESMTQRTITEALMVNPRTEYVRDFSFAWEGDGLHGSFSVKGVDWDDTFRIHL